MAYPSIYPTGATVYDPGRCWNGYTIFQAKELGAALIDMNGNVVQLWDTAVLGASSYNDPEQAACSRLFSNFSQSEWMVFFGDDPYVSLCKELPEPE